MKLKPKNYLGFLAIVATASALLLTFYLRFNNQDSFTVYAEENKVKVDFDLTKNGKGKLVKILERLNIPPSTLSGVSLTPDATSSAQLAHLAPIKANLKINNDSVSISGSTAHNFLPKAALLKKIRVPKSSNLIIFTPMISKFIKSKNLFPSQFFNWMDENLPSENSQYLIFFSKGTNYAWLLRYNADLSNIRNLQFDESLNYQYKEEVASGIVYHLLKFASSKDDIGQTIALFNLNDLTIIASSQEAAFEISDALLSKTDSISFPQDNTQDDVSLALLYTSLESTNSTQNLLRLFLSESDGPNASEDHIATSLDKIERATFILKGDKFSGLINLK